MALKNLMVALSAMRALARDANDSSQVFIIVDALGEGSVKRVTARMRRTARGARLLAARPNLSARLADQEFLRSLPAGSLGREYLAFLKREALSLEGMLAARAAAPRPTLDGRDEDFVANRLSDAHDLWHVVGGYHADVIGEAGVMALSLPQTRNPGIALFALLSVLLFIFNTKVVRGLRVFFHALRRGARCEWLPDQEWEELLPVPLHDVRARLGLADVPSYAPVYRDELGDVSFERSPSHLRPETTKPAQTSAPAPEH